MPTRGRYTDSIQKKIRVLCINMCIAGAIARAGCSKTDYNKQYNKDNAETICEQNKQYYKKNTTKIAARNKVKQDCSVCGGRYTYSNNAHHIRTPKHQGAMSIDSQAVAQHDL